MYGLGSLLVYAAFLPEFRIEHTEVTERDVGGYDIEFRMFKTLFVYRFKPGCPCNRVVIQQGEYQTRNRVFFNGIAAGVGHGYREKTANACTRFEE